MTIAVTQSEMAAAVNKEVVRAAQRQAYVINRDDLLRISRLVFDFTQRSRLGAVAAAETAIVVLAELQIPISRLEETLNVLTSQAAAMHTNPYNLAKVVVHVLGK